MSRALTIGRVGPGVTLQDEGRAGYLGFGLSRGGAVDRLALAEGAALLGQGRELAVLEMAGMGGDFTAEEDLRIALTGAPMRATLDGAALAWNASYAMPKGAVLSIGGARAGSYGYLHVGGGFDAPGRLGARSAHLAAGLGAPLEQGTRLGIGAETGHETGLTLDPGERFGGGTVRIVQSFQTALFPQDEVERFTATEFRRGARGNRMGVPLEQEGDGFTLEGGRNVLSDVVVPGDIQMTGDGTPYVLLAECQTTGGYPRIGTVLPCDMPRLVQAGPGAPLRFTFVTLDEAVELEREAARHVETLGKRLTPLLRDPERMADLLSYDLISGVSAGDTHKH